MIGTTQSNRPANTENLMGYFLNVSEAAGEGGTVYTVLVCLLSVWREVCSVVMQYGAQAAMVVVCGGE